MKFDEKGLVPVIVQHYATGEVLMLGYANSDALRLTLESGHVWFYSRSRQELWHKGATSGNTLEVRSISKDCDSDAVLVKVKPAGPVCHTGNASCFYQAFESDDVI
jgi:phosphoribosyl-ATP pyrophosphohydrolase/phosphoribosyl-AMP cyclohydrolase